MSYNFVKLSEVEKISTPQNASLLIEQNGEIKRLSTDDINFGGGNGGGTQVQADWNETDTDSPAYIWNKPQDAYAPTILNFTWGCGTGSWLELNGAQWSFDQLRSEWAKGTPMRIGDGNIVEISIMSGTSRHITYFMNGTLRSDFVNF